MIKRGQSWLRALLLAMIAVMVVAVPVIAYTYSSTVQVRETGSTGYTYLPVKAYIDNEYLANNGYITSTGLDTRVMSGGTALPHMLTDDKLLFVAPLQGNYSYTLGNSALSSFDIVTGYGGYITRGDDPALELGNNFEIETHGYVDTSAGSDDVPCYKQGAFRTYISAAGSITSVIWGTATTTNLLPNATGDYTDIAGVNGETNHWEAVDDPVASPDDAATYVYTGNTSQEKDVYNIQNGSFSSEAINSVAVYFRTATNQVGFTGYVQPYLRLGSSETAGTEIMHTGTTYTTWNETLTRPGGGDWQVSDIASLQIGVGLRKGTAANMICTQVYAKIDYSPAVSATATGISSEDMEVKTTATGTYLRIYIDDSLKQSTALGGVSVSNNDNDWIIGDGVSDMAYYKHTVSSTLIVWYQPNDMISDTVLPDRQGTAQNGTITWGTNPGDVDVSMSGFVSSEQPEPEVGVSPPTQDIAPPITQPSWFDIDGSLTANPFYSLVKAASDNTGFKVWQIWAIIASLIVVAVALAAWHYLHNTLVAACLSGAAVAFFIHMQIYPFWVIFIFGATIAAIILWERVPAV